MAETLLQRFHRAMAVPQEDASVKLARALGAFPQQGATVQASPPPPSMQPFQGLHNEPYPQAGNGLPPFQLAQDLLPPMQNYMPQQAPPQQRPMPPPQMAPQPQAQPMPQQAPPQQPDPQTVALVQALQQAQQRQLLPEQWKGSFANQYGEPT